MKKLSLTLLLACFGMTTQACEICGCGVGNFYLGMMPRYNNQFVGLRYRYMSFTSRPNNEPEEFSYDTYRSIELWSGFKLGKKWQALTFVPYQFNQRITNEKTLTASGLGDITVLINYRLVNSAAGNGSQQLWLGGGVKVPTGKYKVDFGDPENNLGDPNAQAGSGSMDFLVSTNHILALGKWGLNTAVNYKMNTTNQSDFKFGSRLTTTALLYRSFKVKSLGVTPVVGALYERAGSNQYQNKEVEMTGGQALFANTGIEVNFKKIAAGYSSQLPLAQNISENQTKAKSRGLVHLTFTL